MQNYFWASLKYYFYHSGFCTFSNWSVPFHITHSVVFHSTSLQFFPPYIPLDISLKIPPLENSTEKNHPDIPKIPTPDIPHDISQEKLTLPRQFNSTTIQIQSFTDGFAPFCEYWLYCTVTKVILLSTCILVTLVPSYMDNNKQSVPWWHIITVDDDVNDDDHHCLVSIPQQASQCACSRHSVICDDVHALLTTSEAA